MSLRSPLVMASSDYDFQYLSQFLLLPPLPLFYKALSILKQFFFQTLRPHQPWLSSSISFERANHLLFIAYCKAKKEKKAVTSIITEDESEDHINKAYLCFSYNNLCLDIDSSSSSDKDDNND